MTIEEMQMRKRELGYTNEMLAEMSGVPLGTVQKVFAGATKTPRKQTIDALTRILAKPVSSSENDRHNVNCLNTKPAATMTLQEKAVSYRADSKQGHYTLEDYYAFPDDRRVELIDGYIFDMAAPSQIHQTILAQLYLQLVPCADAHPDCRIFIAPLDVRLDNDDYTMVQPDLLIVCDYHDPDRMRINGAPDFVVEILSPGNHFHDMFRKLYKYKNAGVREYWIIDPSKMRISVYDFEHDELPQSYTFDDTVPLLISEGACSVDFVRIRDVLGRYSLL